MLITRLFVHQENGRGDVRFTLFKEGWMTFFSEGDIMGNYHRQILHYDCIHNHCIR